MPTPKVRSGFNAKPDPAPLTPPETPPDPPAEAVDAQVLDRSEPEVIWTDEGEGLFYELLPDGNRRVDIYPVGLDAEVTSFTLRPVTIGDVIALEKRGISLRQLNSPSGLVELIAHNTVETDFPFAGSLNDRVAQIKSHVMMEPDATLAGEAIFHGVEFDADAVQATAVEVEQERTDGLILKRATLPDSGLTVTLRAEIIADTNKVGSSIKRDPEARMVEEITKRVTRTCVDWNGQGKITSSTVGDLRFGADFWALRKMLKFFRRSKRPRS